VKKETIFLHHKPFYVLLAGLMLAILALAAGALAEDRLKFAGTVKNSQGKGIKDVTVEVLVNGRQLQPLEKGVTHAPGSGEASPRNFPSPPAGCRRRQLQ